MDSIIIFILIVLMLWEFLTWRNLTKYRRLLIDFRQAIVRYIYRRNEILQELIVYANAKNISGETWKQEKLYFPEDGVPIENLGQLMQRNSHMHRVVMDSLQDEKWKALICADKELFYLTDEFNELQGVIGRCAVEYNRNYNALAKRITSMPSSLLAKFLRIKMPEGGLLCEQ